MGLSRSMSDFAAANKDCAGTHGEKFSIVFSWYL